MKGGTVTLFRHALAIFGLINVIATQALAAPYLDSVFGFSVTAPDRWAVTSTMQDRARMVTMTSPDARARAEVRALQLSGPKTSRALRENFARATYPGAVLVGTQPDSFAGLSGETAAWRAAIDGVSHVVGGFFAADGPVGNILLAVTPEAQFARYSPVYDEIFNSFVPGGLITSYAAPEVSRGPANSSFDPVTAGARLLDGLVAEPHPELGFVLVRYDTWQVDQPAPYSLRVGLTFEPPARHPTIFVEALAGSAYDSLPAGVADLKRQLSDLPGIRFDQDGPHSIPNMAKDGVPMPGWPPRNRVRCWHRVSAMC
jgi:hypothetical protein